MKPCIILVCCFILSFSCNKDDDKDLPPDADEYMTVELRGKKTTFQIPVDTVAGVRIGDFLECYISSHATGNIVQTRLSSPRAPGFYPAQFYFIIDSVYYSSDPNFKTQVIYYGNTGEFVRGYYNGMVEDSVGNAFPAKGQYQVRLN
ncbi:MAG TPA: hypothetical protein VGD26_08285 [Chitinophagaceae bacterium]